MFGPREAQYFQVALSLQIVNIEILCPTAEQNDSDLSGPRKLVREATEVARNAAYMLVLKYLIVEEDLHEIGSRNWQRSC